MSDVTSGPVKTIINYIRDFKSLTFRKHKYDAIAAYDWLELFVAEAATAAESAGLQRLERRASHHGLTALTSKIQIL